MARFTILSGHYIQTRQISQDMDNCIFDSAEATTKQLENPPDQGCMAKEMQ
jgi:hypothetical protein